MATGIDTSAVISVYDDMSSSFASTREAIRALNNRLETTPDEFDTKQGISLLSLKHHLLISYMHSLTILSARKALGQVLTERSPPLEQPFSDPQRTERGNRQGDLIDSMIEKRIVLEKIRVLEGRMKYQIEKLVKLSKEGENDGTPIADPLAFKPNPTNLINTDMNGHVSGEEALASDREETSGNGDPSDGIYRPPRVAPTPYLPTTSGKSSKSGRRPPPPKTLAALMTDPNKPTEESASGLGGQSLASSSSKDALSSRARYLNHLTEFEESQFGRVFASKKEEKRRRRDEAVLAIGGELSGIAEDGRNARRGRVAGGLEDAFHDILRDTERSGRSRIGDGYEELRKKGKKASLLERSRSRPNIPLEDTVTPSDGKKRKSRFEIARNNLKRRKAGK